METFCATEVYAEKALRELALQVLPPPGGGNQRPAAEQALGHAGFATLNHLFFDLVEHADEFMPVRDEVAPQVRRAQADAAGHVDVQVKLPWACARTSVRFNELLDLVERLSADAVLGTPPPSGAVTRFRRWYLQQIHAQLVAGPAPHPFPQ